MAHTQASCRTRGAIRVLAADDSALMRRIYRNLFSTGAAASVGGLPVELCGLVEDGYACLEAVRSTNPDLLLLDIEMPRMHGLEVLRRMRELRPELPVILCSSATEYGARITLDALAMGAADYVTKPELHAGSGDLVESLGRELSARIAAFCTGRQGAAPPAMQRSAENVPEVRQSWSQAQHAGTVEAIVIGASTGGPSALEAVLCGLPRGFPVPVLIAQHMPRPFTRAFAERLSRSSGLPVREARDGAPVEAGRIWVAPGDSAMEVTRVQATDAVVLRIRSAAPGACSPSVDALFASAARTFGPATLAVVMTGMGADGLDGARRVYAAGGVVYAQDVATSAVWGMPGRVYEAGIAEKLLPVHGIAAELLARTQYSAAGALRATRAPMLAENVPTTWSPE